MVAIKYAYITLGFGLLVMIFAGNMYDYSAYGPTLKKELNFTQTQVTLVGTFGNFGMYLGFGIGVLYHKAGMRITAIICSSIVGIAYLLSGIATIDKFHSAAFYILCIFYFMIGQGNYGLYIGTMEVNMRNFEPKHRGKIAGILASGFGISSALLTLIYRAFFSHQSTVRWFLIFSAISTSIVGIAGAFIMRIESEKKEYNKVQSISEENTSPNIDKEPLMDNVELTDEHSKNLETPPEEEFSPLQAIKTLNYWLIFISFIFGAGSGLMVINNIGSLRLTFGGTEGDNTQIAMVTLLSVCGFVGRIGFGWLSDFFQHKTTRAFWLSILGILMSIAHFIFFLFPSAYMLMELASLTGFIYGGFFATVPIILNFYFGQKHFAANYGVMILAPAIGGFSMNFLSGRFYDMHVTEGTQCYGKKCFSAIFLLSSILNCVGAAASFYLHLRKSKKLCTKVKTGL